MRRWIMLLLVAVVAFAVGVFAQGPPLSIVFFPQNQVQVQWQQWGAGWTSVTTVTTPSMETGGVPDVWVLLYNKDTGQAAWCLWPAASRANPNWTQ